MSLDNYIAMISGQPASLDTQRDCPTFSDFKQTGTTGDGIATGNGCVYPASVKTLPDQLKAHGHTWRGHRTVLAYWKFESISLQR